MRQLSTKQLLKGPEVQGTTNKALTTGTGATLKKKKVDSHFKHDMPESLIPEVFSRILH
jgi:hypothetical protein